MKKTRPNWVKLWGGLGEAAWQDMQKKELAEQKLNLETEDPMTMLDDLLQQATTITKKYSKASK